MNGNDAVSEAEVMFGVVEVDKASEQLITYTIAVHVIV